MVQEFGNENGSHHASYSPPHSLCDKLIELKLDANFHRELGKSEVEYIRDYSCAVDNVLVGGERVGQLVLVEPRIPFARQLELLGIVLDPAVFSRPSSNINLKPYARWVEVLTAADYKGCHLTDMRMFMDNLPVGMRPASPLEGVNGDFYAILEESFVMMPGGCFDLADGTITGYNSKHSSLCLEEYKGLPRVSQIRLDQYDGLIGLLAVH